MKFLRSLKEPVSSPITPIRNFLVSLSEVAPPAGRGAYAFKKPDGHSRGFVQFIISSGNSATIHRLWTLEPGKGNGRHMLQTLCTLADRHGVVLTLKPLPIGRKPYPLSREELRAWYQRCGFLGERKMMVRQPASQSSYPLSPLQLT